LTKTAAKKVTMVRRSHTLVRRWHCY